jgi:DNA-binding winged helix-turn-helix (wHTH) protein/TolB-like protein
MPNSHSRIYSFGEYRLEVERRLLWRKDQPVTISPKVYELLQALVESPGQPLSKDELLTRVWHDALVEESNLTVSMSALRKVLGEQRGEHQFIVTLPGVGYQFVAPVTLTAPPLVSAREFSVLVSEPESEEIRDLMSKPLATVITPSALDPTVLQQVSSPLTVRPVQQILTAAPSRRNLWMSLTLLVVIGLLSGWYWFNRPPQRVAQVRSLAVLPFTPLAPQNGDEVLGLGLADSLIMRLSNVGGASGLTVRPTNAIQAFTEPRRDLQKIGRALQVEAVLDGRWQRVNEQVQLSAQLVRTTDGAILWAERLEEQETNLLAFQKSVTERLAHALTLQFTAEQRQRLQKDYTANPAALEEYMRGRYFMVKRDRASMLKAIAAFEQAIEHDPAYALAWSGIADCYLILSNAYAMMGTPDLSTNLLKAKTAAERALALDDSLAEAHTALAGVHSTTVLFDEAIARREYAHARELNPNYPTFYLYAGQALLGGGSPAQALPVFQRGRELDPLSPAVNTLLGTTYYTLGRFAEAETQLKRTLELEPDFVRAQHSLGLVYEAQKKYAEALTHYQRAAELSNNGPLALSALAHLHAVQGQRAEAEALLTQIETAAEQGQLSYYFVALVHIALGHHDQAMDLLERQPRTYPKGFPKIDPQCDSLRGKPRFEALVRSLTP